MSLPCPPPLPTPATFTAFAATVSTPADPYTLVATAGGDADPPGSVGLMVIAGGWTVELSELLSPVAPELRPAPEAIEWRPGLGPLTDAIDRWSDGELTALDDVAVHQRSGPFLEQTWTVLRKVPPGEPVTYTELAALAGRPAAVRAAASACARNAVALFVPCHRVLRTGGGLGGYRWGVDVKAKLLSHEAR